MFSSWLVSVSSRIVNRHLGTNVYNIGVDKKCEEFPHADQSQPFEGRKLQGTLDLLNTSSVNISESHRIDAVRGGVSPYHTDATNITLAPQKSPTFSR